MRLRLTEPSPLKKPFIAAGIVGGIAVSVRYLYRNHLRGVMPGSRAIPDPVWTQFVNVALIMFVAIYLANLLRRLFDVLAKKGKQG